MNIIRIKLPDEVIRVRPFNVKEYGQLLMIRGELDAKDHDEQNDIINELLEELYPEYNKIYRPFIFLNVLILSMGEKGFNVSYECCDTKKNAYFYLYQDELKYPSITIDDVTINFNFTEIVEPSMIADNINSVVVSDIKYNWDDLDNNSKYNIMALITHDKFNDIMKSMHVLHKDIKIGCDSCKKRTITYTNILDIFKVVLNPDEIFLFYQTNHILVNNNYSLESVLNMIPAERRIAMSLVRNDKEKEK